MPAAGTAPDRRLALVRTVHTAIYVVMAASTFVLLYGAITGRDGLWLWIALGLLAIETIVFVGNGFSCPLTALARRYGAQKGYAFDTFLPERATRYTFQFFGTIMIVSVLILAARWFGLVG